MNKIKIVAAMLIIAHLMGCAGRAANPVTVRQAGDRVKSCSVLRSEMSNIENNVQKLTPQSEKTGKNVALGVAGAFVWPLWLFMDLSTAEKEEINAYRMRHDYLLALYQEKSCKA